MKTHKQLGICLLPASWASALVAVHGVQMDPRDLLNIAVILFSLAMSAFGGYLLGKDN
jgi:hypothetical protein